MHLSGEYSIPAKRETVWEGLNDPTVLQQCIPGCEELEKVSDTEFTAKVTAKVGPVKAKFAGAVTLSDLDPPNSYRISGEGKGGAAGFGKGSAIVTLSDGDAPESTLLKYEADASVGGKLAQIGARLVEGTAKKYADDFFTRFSAIVGTEAPVEAPPAATAAAPSAAPESEPTVAAETTTDATTPLPSAGPAAPAQATDGDTPAPAEKGTPPEPKGKGGIPAPVWALGVIVIVILLILVFGS